MNPDTGTKYRITYMCAYIGISRAAYYKYLNRTPPAHELENNAIAAYMTELEEAHHYIFGVERLAMYINEETVWHVSQGRVRRLMQKHHITASIRVKKHDRKAEKKEYILANKLLTANAKHDFHPDGPNEVWVTDCTELTYGVHNQAKIRLSVIKDLYDHSIVAWNVAPTETSALVTKTVVLALENTQGEKPNILHSDQGSGYTSGVYNTLLTSKGITHSMSRPGTPGDNSPMESLWSHGKDEYFQFEHAQSELEMMQNIEHFVYAYNNERRQPTLNGMTPIEFRNHAVQEIA